MAASFESDSSGADCTITSGTLGLLNVSCCPHRLSSLILGIFSERASQNDGLPVKTMLFFSDDHSWFTACRYIEDVVHFADFTYKNKEKQN